jgi:hypothetical protein
MLPGPVLQVVQTTCFNFTKQLYSMVSNHVLFGKKLDNLDANADDPSDKNAPINRLLSTIL